MTSKDDLDLLVPANWSRRRCRQSSRRAGSYLDGKFMVVPWRALEEWKEFGTMDESGILFLEVQKSPTSRRESRPAARPRRTHPSRLFPAAQVGSQAAMSLHTQYFHGIIRMFPQPIYAHPWMLWMGSMLALTPSRSLSPSASAADRWAFALPGKQNWLRFVDLMDVGGSTNVKLDSADGPSLACRI
jgi:hypothetical protein